MPVPEPQRRQVDDFRIRVRATPTALGTFRDGLRDWLGQFPLNPADAFDVVLACSECLTLVIEDRPRQVALVIEVSAGFEGDRIVVVARDYGLWHESHAEPCEEPLALSLMRALMDSVEWERHHDGQTITLSRRVGRI
jgi:anti-sigma regulatory factor (Ser/Thr protein kinase)